MDLSLSQGKLAFTLKNENLVRDFFFKEWIKYYAKRRQRHMVEMESLAKASKRYKELASTRYLKRVKPEDLSGACKVSAQLALIVFPLDGVAVSNKRHTFVVTSKDQIYDLNRYCNDVACMKIKNRDPYEVNMEYSESDEALAGRESWKNFLNKLIERLDKHLTSLDGVELHTGKDINRIPKWAQVEIEQPLLKAA